jgi:hypothetical protein
VVSAVIGTARMTKILMDGGSSINILYKDAFDKLNVDVRKLHASQSPFHGIVPGRRIMPLGTIDLSVTFGDAVHYQKEILFFEVVDFQGPYSAIFGRPCYVKFMAVPNYAYLKIKMPGPHSVVTLFGNFQNTYQCERDAVKYADTNALDLGPRGRIRSGALGYPCSLPEKKLMLMAPRQPSPAALDPSASTRSATGPYSRRPHQASTGRRPHQQWEEPHRVLRRRPVISSYVRFIFIFQSYGYRFNFAKHFIVT